MIPPPDCQPQVGLGEGEKFYVTVIQAIRQTIGRSAVGKPSQVVG